MVVAALALVVVLVVALGPFPVTSTAAGDPGLSESREALDGALACPTGFASAAHDPVLLVHGTASTPEENWGWNWARALPALNFPTCTVRLPDRAVGDIQRSAEYVVAAVRTMQAQSGRPIDVVGHSQGGLVARWALRWWPSLRAGVDDLITLGSPGNGVQGIDLLLTNPVCTPACHQMLPGSKFLAALGRSDPQPNPVSYTSISSQDDRIIQPVTGGGTEGGQRELLVQSICPGRSVGHIEMVADAVVFALGIDALTKPGPADPGRVDRGVCSQILAPETDVLGKLQLDVERFVRSVGQAPKTPSSEPPLAAYAAG